MAEERIDIVVSERGSRVVRRNIENIGNSSQKAAGGVDFLKRALVGLGAVVSAREVIRLLDTYTNLQNRLRATGLEAQNLSAVYNQLLGVANQTRSSFEGSVELYSRLAISSKELGVSQQELINFTKSLNQAIILSGASATEAQAGLIQLSQGMASGTLRGDELRSVLEQLPAVADVIAKQLGVTRGELRTMGEEGKITANTILDAFKASRQELEDRFGKTVPTISQSFQVLKNNIVDLVGRLDESTGASALLSKALLGIANNLDTVAKVAASVAAGFVLIGGASKAITLATTAVRALNVAIAANPIGFLLIVLTSAITALTLFRDQIKLGTDDVTTLGDLMRALGEVVGAAFRKMYEAAKATFGPLADLVSGFFDEVDFSVIGILRLVARGVDAYVGLWRGAIDAVIELFKGLPSAIGDLFTRALNVLLGKITEFVNGAIELLEPLTNLADIDIKPVDFLLANDNEGAAAKLGANIGNAFKEGFESVSFAEDLLDNLTTRAQEIGRQRKAAEEAAAAGGADLSAGGGRGPSFSAAQLKELEQLVSSYDKVYKAQQEYTKGVQLLDQATAAGVLTEERRAEVLALMQGQLKDSLDPLGALNREMERENELLGLTADQREIANQLRTIEQDLLTQGVILGEAELAQLREKLTLLQEETKISAARDQILQSTIGSQEEFATQLQAINQLMAEGLITQGQATAYLVEQNSTLLEGTIEAQQAWVEQYNQTYAQIEELRQADLISEQTAVQLKARAQADLYSKQLQNAQSFFGNLASLSSSENKKLAAIGKAAAVTQATIDGVLAVQKALASAPPPVNFALAAAVGVATAANVASILSQNTAGYAFGGDFEVGGTGGTDSQLVAFRATPGESVSIRTPTQNRDEARQGGGEGQQSGAPRIVNVIDPALVGDFLNSPNGEEVFVNMIRNNSDTLRSIVSEG